mgnify:FL=1
MKVYIHKAVRTAVGSFNGQFKNVSAVQLGVECVKACSIDDHTQKQIKPDQVIMGNVLSAGVGQAPARQVALASGLHPNVICTTVNKVCSSGLKAVIMACQSIKLQDSGRVIAGGMESMSNAPLLLTAKARRGIPYGMGELTRDSILTDGLLDPLNNKHMGEYAEDTAKKYNISRKDQDDYAEMSYQRSAMAWKEKLFKNEIVPVSDGKAMITEDEEYKKIDYARLRLLKPVFVNNETGTITAGNASKINDGAAAVYLSNDPKGAMAEVLSYGEAECEPESFAIAPSLAIPIALDRAGLTTNDVSLFEINEAFSAVAIANQRILNIPMEKLNTRGGAVSLGHPIGSSGCRLLVTLCHALKDDQIGVVGICNGGGGASALVIRKL